MQPVSIVKCEAKADDKDIMQAVNHALDLIGGYAKIFSNRRKILIKPNIGTDRVELHQGRQIYLTEPIIVESIVRMVRECSKSEIIIGDIPLCKDANELFNRLGYNLIAEKYGNVRIVNFNEYPYELIAVDNPAIFTHYTLSKEICDIDITVSIAKMKAHHTQGATLCLKNLFGLTPTSVYGAPRLYLHDLLIRLPRVLVDLCNIVKPELCIVDGLVSANQFEWDGETIETNLIMAGYNAVAIDTIGMIIMGLDPKSDYPDYPFFYHNNPLNIASEFGLGDNCVENIHVFGEKIDDVKRNFEVKRYGPANVVDRAFKEKGKQQVRRYIDLRDDFVAKYSGKYMAMGDGEPLWVSDTIGDFISEMMSLMYRGIFPYFTIKVVPESDEIELFDVYEKYL